jgi:hypothetical protein
MAHNVLDSVRGAPYNPELWVYLFDIGDGDQEPLAVVAPHFKKDPEGFMRAVTEVPYFSNWFCSRQYGTTSPARKWFLAEHRNGRWAWDSMCPCNPGAWAHGYGESSDD